jgi:hypothetical protein
MKPRIFFFVALLLLAASAGFAQSVKITTRKVTYKRSPQAPEHKRTFTIEHPVVAGPMGRKIAAILSYEKNFDFTIAEETRELFWLENALYTVNYNKYNILDVTLMIEGSGAYPSSSLKYLIVNTKTGTRVKPSDVFTNAAGLAELGQKALREEITSESARLKQEEPDFDPAEYFRDATFTIENLWDFTVSDDGLTFHYDYGFPHVAQALEPTGDFRFSWAELAPFIKKDGLFGRFVK